MQKQQRKAQLFQWTSNKRTEQNTNADTKLNIW